MKRIIFSTYDSLKNPYYGGGGAIAIHEVAKRLTTDFDVTVLCGAYPGSHKQTVDHVRYVPVGWRHAGPLWGQLSFTALLPVLAKQHSFDVWIDSLTPPWGFSLLPMVLRKPVIGLVHMLPATDMQRKYHIPFELLQTWGIRHYRHIITTSEAFTRSVRKLNTIADIRTIQNGVTPIDVTVQPVPASILFLGRIEMNQKGLDLLIAAYRLIERQLTIPLIIAGTGLPNEVRRLREAIRHAGLTDRVRIVGRVSGKTKDALFREAAAVVVASRFETFSMVALEAMSYGVPLVTFNLDGLKWIPLDCRRTATPYRTDTLAAGIMEAVRNATFRKKAFQSGRAYAKRFSWNSVTDLYRKRITAII